MLARYGIPHHACPSMQASVCCSSTYLFMHGLMRDCLALQYVIHFGSSAQDAAQQVTNTIAAAHPDKPAPPVTALAKLRTGVAVVPTQTGSQLVSPLAGVRMTASTGISARDVMSALLNILCD